MSSSIRQLAILIVLFAYSQAIIASGFDKIECLDLGTLSEPDYSAEGFEKLRESIGNKRIVVIGEQDHGVGSLYTNFMNLTRFLNEEMGFRVIIQEYSFSDFSAIRDSLENQGVSNRLFLDAMYWPQGRSVEYAAFYDYVDQSHQEEQIILEGFDPRLGNKKFVEEILKKAITLYKGYVAFSDNFMTIAENVLQKEYKDDIDRDEAIQFLDELIELIALLGDDSLSSRDQQVIKSFLGFAKNAWNVEGYEFSSFTERFHHRERQMADNIRWFIDEEYPDEKIIIYTHNGHAAKNINSLERWLPDSIGTNLLTVGSILNDYYPQEIYYLATTAYKGTYSKWDFIKKEVPIPHDSSLETYLEAKECEYGFVNLWNIGEIPFYMFFNDFNIWLPAKTLKAPFGTLFDGIVFIENVSAPSKLD